MKRFYIAFFALAALFACSKEQVSSENPSPVKEGTTYSIELSAPSGEDSTKITLGDYDGSKYTLKWKVGDRLQMYNANDNNNKIYLGTTDSLTADDIKDGKATFKFTTTDSVGTIIKFNLNSNLNSSKTYGISNLSANQVQNGLGTDYTDITPYDYCFYSGSIKLGTTTTVTAEMQRPLSIVKIPFWSEIYAGWKVEKISLSRDDFGKVAGEYGTNSATTSNKSFVKINSTVDSVITLTFNNDVTVPADEASAQPAFIQAFPTEVYQKDVSPVEKSYVVMIQISKDGVRKYFARKFTAVLESGKVKNFQVGLLEDKGSKFQVKEYSKVWERGCDMVFAGDTINRNKEGYTSMKKLAADELTYDIMNTGGLIFATDNVSSASIVDLASGYSKMRSIASKKSLSLVGDRIYDGGQTTLKVVEMRTYGNVLMANLKLIPSEDNSKTASQYNFLKYSGDTKSTDLKLADCQIDATGLSLSAIGDGNGAVYSKIRLDNCIVKIKAGSQFYRLLKTDDVTERTIELNNNVFYWSEATSASSSNIISFKPGNTAYTAANLTISMSCNTIENCFPSGIVYCGTAPDVTLGNINVDKALVYAHDQLTLQFSTGKFLVFPEKSGKLGNCSNSYMAANNCYNSKSSCDAYIQPWYFTGITNTKQGTSCTACPFAEGWSESAGYFPVDRTVVTNGAGASYDTKYYFSKPQ